MNVSELKEVLADMPDDWPVVMSIDPEGNGFGQLGDIEKGRWDSRYSSIKLFELTEELREDGYSDEDFNPNLPPVVVLWPI